MSSNQEHHEHAAQDQGHEHAHHDGTHSHPATVVQPSYSYQPWGGYYPGTVLAGSVPQQVVGSSVPVATQQAVQLQAPGIAQSQFLGTTKIENLAHQPVKGESRIEYVPYEKTQIEYEPVERTEYVAKEKKVVDHYMVEYVTEYIPQVYQDKYIEYIPQERVVERVEYVPVERQVIHQPQQEVVQQPVQTVQYVPQPVQYVQQPVQYIQQPISEEVKPVTTQSVIRTLPPNYSYAPVQAPVYGSQAAYYLTHQGPATQTVAAKTSPKPHKPHDDDKGLLERLFD